MNPMKNVLPIAVLAVASLGLICGCKPAPPPKVPDLAIEAIKIDPPQPRSGRRFAVEVRIENKGGAASGQYDLAMHIRDVSRGLTYPVGTFRQSALQSGQRASWRSEDRMVNNPGAHQYWVKIQPFLFEDGNEQNNTHGWAFEVNP